MGVAKPPKAQRGKRAAAASTGGVGPGGGNFVRINMKGGTKKPYHSSRSAAAAARGRRRGGGRGGGGSRFGGPTLLPQAGDGADFLDGARGPRAGQSGRCFKCGGSGHWAKDCGGLLADGTAADEVAAGEAAAAAAREAKSDPAAAAAAAAAAARPPPPPSLVDTLPPAPAPLDDPTDASAVEAAVSAAHGGRIAAFRGRQAEVVGALMAGRSVLAVLPTGAGKSLCYTAAALARAGTVLVVTPLLALARDQLAHLPPGLPAAALDGAMPRPAARGVLAALASGALRVLFVAPERLASPSFLAAIARMPRAAEGQEPSSSLPRNPLPLVCVDEAHCLDEWGHTFRPAYFRLGRILRERLRPAAVLALTATATVRTRAAIAGALGIPYPDGAIVDAGVRPNLRLAAVTSSGGVDGGGARNALLRLLRPGGALAGCRRAIVYVPFQAAAESLAGGLSAAGVAAVCYHAGRAHAAREAAHAAFVAGAARVLVATVAYGMGVDVPGVDAVLHAALPRSVEEYVQQVGRGGRDCSPPAAAAGRPGAGRPAAGGPGAPDAPPPARPPPPPEARCVALVDDADYRRLRSLTEADGVTPAGVGRLLAAIFGGEAEEEGGGAEAAPGAVEEEGGSPPAPAPAPPPPPFPPHHYRVLDLASLALALDAKAEVVETLLAYLEDLGGGGEGGGPLSQPPLLTLHAPVGPRFRVAFYRSAPETLAAADPVVSAILDAAGKPRRGLYSGSTAALAAALGRPPADALSAVAGLAARGECRLDADAGKGGSAFGCTVVCLISRPMNGAALASALAARHGRVVDAARARLDASYRALKGAVVGGEDGGGAAPASPSALPPPFCAAAEGRLRAAITAYFEGGDGGDDAEKGEEGESDRLAGLPLATADRLLAADLRLLLAHARSASAPPSPHPLTPRAAARILHGLGTPGFPAIDWAGCGVWGRYSHLDFASVIAAASDAWAEDRAAGGAPLEAVGGLPSKRGRGRGGFGGLGGGSGRRAGGGWPAGGGGGWGGGGGRGRGFGPGRGGRR